MDEMTMLRDLGRSLAPEDLAPPESLLHRSLPRRRPRRRAPLLLAAAAVAGALVVAPTLLTGDDQHPGPASAAAAVLERAADAAADDPVLTVPPGGFVYVESVGRSEADTIEGGVEKRELGPLTDRRIWLSADGEGSGLIQERRHGRGAWSDTRLDGPTGPAYRSGLPTGTTAMLHWIYDHDNGGNPPDVQAFTTVGASLREAYVPPRSTAAMFRAAARIPGVSVVSGERDGLGRPAVAVAVDNGVARLELLFDPGTSTFLGDKAVQNAASPLGPAGATVNSFTIVRTAAASRAGQVPE